jgi:hypothetical protein
MSDPSRDALPACDQLDPQTLAAWVDGALTSAEAREAVAAHVAACPGCAAHGDELRAHRQRLAGFRATTTPAALPAGFGERVGAGLDRIDARRRPAPRRAASRPRLLGVTAAIVAILAAIALPVALQLRPHPVVPVELLARTPLTTPAGSTTLATHDADRAARWLSGQLGVEIPTVNLSLVGAQARGAWADKPVRRGALLYQGARGVPVALYLYVDPRATLPPLRPVRYDESTYRVLENRATRRTLVAWQADGRTFVAAAPLPLAELLPYAREMDRHCRRRP